MELKNSYEVGLHTELQVIQNLIQKKATIIYHRAQTPFAEIDILFRSAKGRLVLLEVKTLSNWIWIETRLTKKQTVRLKKAALYFENKMKESVQICVAFVIQNKIYYLPVD